MTSMCRTYKQLFYKIKVYCACSRTGKLPEGIPPEVAPALGNRKIKSICRNKKPSTAAPRARWPLRPRQLSPRSKTDVCVNVFFPHEFASTWQTLTFLDSMLFFFLQRQINRKYAVRFPPTNRSCCGWEGGSGGVPERFACLLFMFARRCRERSLAHARPALAKAPVLGRYLVSIQESGSRSEHPGGGANSGCASTFIFFITKPALTQIMERTGSLSERQ